MLINGTEYKFVYNVFARCELDKECKKAGYTNFQEAVNNSYPRSIVIMAVACSRGYEYAESVKDPGYKQKALRPEELLVLPAVEFAELDAEVNAAFSAGSERTVEEAQPKRKNGASARKSN